MSANNPSITLSLITPAYNNPEEVRKLLKSVAPDVAKDPTMEVIVVDDDSKDDALKKVVEESGFARYIKLEKNSGPAKARNIGAGAAKNSVLIFVDSDVVFNNDTISRIRERFQKDDAVEIFGGEYDVEPENPSLSAKFKSLMVCGWRPKEDFITVFVTRLVAIKKSIFDKLGGFDTSLKTAAVEDYEFGRRLINNGHRIHYDPTITVKHHFPTFRKQIKLFFHRSFMWLYIFKKYRKFDNTCTTPLSGIAQLCGFAAVFFLLISLTNTIFIYVSLFFFALFILTNLRFFKLAFKHEGLFFTIISIFMALIISCSIVLGGICGFIYYSILPKAK